MQTNKKIDFFEIMAWGFALVAFSPALLWLVRGLFQSQQLRDAMIIMLSALAVLAVEQKIRPHVPRVGKAQIAWLICAYAAFFVSQFFGVWGALVILAGLTMAIIAAGLACFDKPRYVYAAGGAFYAFTLLSFFIKLFDLPLRIWAGELSAKILALFNKSVQLLASGSVNPQIAMRVDGKTYMVATECNGFGIISSCLILSIVMAIFSNSISWWRRLLIPVISILIAYFANSMRIVFIVATATLADAKWYDFIHEFWGYFFFALALISVWIFSRKS